MPALTIAQAGSDFFRDRSESNCIQDNGAFCVGWVLDNFDRYVDPFREHVVLVGVSVGLGFLIAFAMALASHRRRWLVPPFIGATGVLYTIPSLAFFFLLLPITGRGADTAIIALTAFTLQIIYRNIVAGLARVPAEVKDAGRGMGMTERQLLWRIELPLAVPEIIAGVRVATVSTVAIASLAVFAGGGGLGSQLVAGSNITFRTGVVTASALLIGLAIAIDFLLLSVQRRLTRWRSVGEARKTRRSDLLRTLARRVPRTG
jgi:osmoprotectant transport system permease protein